MKKAVLLAVSVTSLSVAQAQVITAWTFENNSIAVNNSPAPSTGTGTASALGMATYATPNIGVTTCDVLQGASSDTGTNGVADTTQVWRIRAQAGASGAAANGWSSAAPVGTQGVMFAASTVGYSNINVKFDWYATTQGEANLQLLYTTDGSTWHNVPLTLSGSDAGLAVMTNTTSPNTVMGSYVSITGGTGQDWFTGLSAAITDPNAANNPKFAIEIVNASTGADDISAAGTALNNTSGNWRFDNVTISSGSTAVTPTGNLVLSRSVYAGDASTIVLGQGLPPVCPSTAVCATAPAVSNGLYPNTSNSSNVWNNDTADPSFGITSPIFLDTITPTGTLVSTLAIPTGFATTSFSSKSELALNLSTDGTAITFMAYVAPPNTVDVSNANTPEVYDPTNPSGGSFFRGVVQVGANGAMQLTKTNAYNGNNGRAAILANGLYYLVGNSNNGSATAANVVGAGGMQIATPGQAATTLPTQLGNFSITQLTNPATGAPYTADKAGKDANFRGLTIFNNTLYISKGSGSNGVNTVYQVGTAGILPPLTNASSVAINILPGFNAVPNKDATNIVNYPFGLWFANATTLYVADEGDGTVADAATSTNAGLEKWILVNGAWQMAYVLQNGLNLGKQYSVPNYPSSIAPATDGLRNITGKVNGDGTVTIWAVTSTVSANGDQGADPNMLVSITDTLANTTAAGAASEKFTVLMTAPAGTVYRGICFAPVAGPTPASNSPSVVSAASWSTATIAPGQLVTAFGQNLAPATPDENFGPAPTTYYGNSVSLVDAAGKTWAAPLVFVAPDQVTFQVPSGVATGSATANFTSSVGTQTAGNLQVAAVAPSIFTLNGSQLATAETITVSPTTGAQTYGTTYQAPVAGSEWVASPINVSGGPVYLVLYGTGFDAATASTVTVTINGVNAQVLYSGSQGLYTGLDQVNVLIPASLKGAGNVEVQLTANGIAANAVQIVIQ